MDSADEVRKAAADLREAETELEVAEREDRAALKHVEHALEELEEANRHHEIHFWVDGEEYSTDRNELTSNEIIREFGKKDPASNYLVKIHGVEKVSYRGKGDEPIHIHNGEKFQIISTGPTPVSDETGVSLFSQGLRDCGYSPVAMPNAPNHLALEYPVEVGRFRGQTVRLGFVVPPDFPNITPSGPHVSPQLLPFAGQGPHPSGGIHPPQSPLFEQTFGGQWQYWSRPCSAWGTSKKTVSAYMAHIWHLWKPNEQSQI